MTQTTELLTAGVEILYLDKLGYGPNGSMMRKDWRAECLKNLLAGRNEFEAWQLEMLAAEMGTHSVSLSLRIDGVVSHINPRDIRTLDFAGHLFDENLTADDFKFLLPCSFNCATFSGSACFGSATFSRKALFQDAIFNGYMGFQSVAFSEDADFKSAIFNGHAEFQSATFSGHAGFESATFSGDAWFGKAEFKGDSLFQRASFEKSSDFENAVFEKVGHYENATFTKLPPNFKGVKTDVTRLEFSDDSYFPKSYSADDDIDGIIRNISTLKRLSDEHGQSDQALNFNAMELRAKQVHLIVEANENKEKWWSGKRWQARVTGWYETFSDFGRSYTRPLKAYVILLLITVWLALAHAVYYSAKGCEGENWYLFSNLWRDQIECVAEKKDSETKIPLSGWRAAFEYTSYRASGILDFADSDKQTMAISNRLFGQPIEPWWMRIWGVFKAIASTALLFLAALGLRNKYRIK